MEAGPLRYEMDLYNLIVSIFKQRLAQFGIVAEEWNKKRLLLLDDFSLPDFYFKGKTNQNNLNTKPKTIL